MNLTQDSSDEVSQASGGLEGGIEESSSESTSNSHDSPIGSPYDEGVLWFCSFQFLQDG